VPTLADVVAVLDEQYDPSWAASWDAVGLVCGDPAAPVRRVLFAVDPVEAVVAEAIAYGADLIVAHHPLLLRAVHGVAATTPKGRLVHDMIRNGIALHVAHTNADVASPGVSDALAAAVGVVDGVRPLVASDGDPLDKLVTFVPHDDVDRVVDALAAAGAGALGAYSRCAYLVDGTGTFLPGEGAEPTIGAVGRVEVVPGEAGRDGRAARAARRSRPGAARRASVRGARLRRRRGRCAPRGSAGSAASGAWPRTPRSATSPARSPRRCPRLPRASASPAIRPPGSVRSPCAAGPATTSSPLSRAAAPTSTSPPTSATTRPARRWRTSASHSSMSRTGPASGRGCGRPLTGWSALSPSARPTALRWTPACRRSSPIRGASPADARCP
jgi:putative NIF3 family GTP cyclohydrolase 1 type 2